VPNFGQFGEQNTSNGSLLTPVWLPHNKLRNISATGVNTVWVCSMDSSDELQITNVIVKPEESAKTDSNNEMNVR
jgi:hypothetical protein